MISNFGEVYLTTDGDMIDDLCFRQYGRQSGAVEHVLTTNRHLQSQPTALPHGIPITFRPLPLPTKERTVRLWDYGDVPPSDIATT